MEKERKIEAPEGCEIEKVEIIDGVAVVTFKKKEQKLPKTWEEFCEMFLITKVEHYINNQSEINNATIIGKVRSVEHDKNMIPDRETAEAVLALCQLIQLRNAYNGEWVPDWNNYKQDKHTIEFHGNEIFCDMVVRNSAILSFKSEELRDKFLENFGDLVEKLKPLYGIKEGGEK